MSTTTKVSLENGSSTVYSINISWKDRFFESQTALTEMHHAISDEAEMYEPKIWLCSERMKCFSSFMDWARLVHSGDCGPGSAFRSPSTDLLVRANRMSPPKSGAAGAFSVCAIKATEERPDRTSAR